MMVAVVTVAGLMGVNPSARELNSARVSTNEAGAGTIILLLLILIPILARLRAAGGRDRLTDLGTPRKPCTL